VGVTAAVGISVGIMAISLFGSLGLAVGIRHFFPYAEKSLYPNWGRGLWSAEPHATFRDVDISGG
jgi:hypothetical protein